AQVIQSIPVYRSVDVRTPQQQCWQEEVVRRDRRNDYRSGTPGLLGAVIGGAIGNAVGHNKSNKRVGAVVGAILGGSVGRDISNQNRAGGTVYHDTVERCETVYSHREEQKLVGYDVYYGYNGQEYSVRLPRNPGATLRVRVNVEPVL
ncbi:MAG: glycine zipper 2TM domain-containing protein, partial [Pseudohongiellaceae bacterium]